MRPSRGISGRRTGGEPRAEGPQERPRKGGRGLKKETVPHKGHRSKTDLSPGRYGEAKIEADGGGVLRNGDHTAA